MQPALRIARGTAAVGLTRASPGAQARRVLVVKLALDLAPDPGEPQRSHAHPRTDDPPMAAEDLAPRDRALEAFAPGATVPLPHAPDASADSALDRASLPDLAPVVDLTSPDAEVSSPVEMRCDELRREADGHLVLTWRGVASDRALARADRVVVTFETSGRAAPPRARLGELARARLGYVVEEEDLGRGATPEEEARLELERYVLSAEGAEPLLTLEAYARVAAELAEGRAPRTLTLAQSGLDEVEWSIEERAWLTRIADAGQRGDPSLAIEYGEHFTRAQDAAVPATELDASVHEYVAVLVRMSEVTDPGPLLAHWSLSLADWMRLERHWQRRMDADPDLRQEVERMIEDAKRALAADRVEDEGAT